MALNLGELYITLGADTKKLKSAENSAKTFTNHIINNDEKVKLSSNKVVESKLRGLNKISKSSSRTGDIGKESFNTIDKSIEKLSKSVAKVNDLLNLTLLATSSNLEMANKAAKVSSVGNSKVVKSLNEVSKSTVKVGKTGTREFGKVTKSSDKLSKSLNKVKMAVKLVITSMALLKTVQLTDEFQILQQRIKSATKFTGDYERVNRALIRTSMKTGVSLSDNAKLFQSLARVAPQLGATNSEILTLTDTIGKLSVIGGAAPEQLSNGLLQLTQGLGGLKFRAEEWNSIRDSIPEIASRIASGMDKTTSSMYQAIIAQKVYSVDVFNSLLKQSQAVSNEFSNIQLSISASTNVLKTSFSNQLGKIDNVFGVTAGISSSILNFSSIINKDISPTLIVIKDTFDVITRSVSDTILGLGKWLTVLGLIETQNIKIEESSKYSGNSVKLVIKDLLKYSELIPNTISYAFKVMYEYIRKLQTHITAVFKQVTLVAKTFSNMLTFKFNKSSINDLLNLSKKISEISTEKDARLANINARLEALKRERNSLIATKELQRNIRITQAKNNLKYVQEVEARISTSKRELLSKKLQGVVDTLPTEREINLDSNSDVVKAFNLQRELDIEREFYEQSLTEVNNAEALKIESIKSYQEIKEQLLLRHQINIANINKKYAAINTKTAAIEGFLKLQTNAEIAEKSSRQRGEEFRNLLDQASSHNKKLFQVMKLASIATATIEGNKAVMSAFKHGTEVGGPILGAAYAGIAMAASAIMIADIYNTKFNGSKAVGGDVFAGGVYRVNENGPEMLTIGNQSMLMMGNQTGKITPNDKIGSGNRSNSIVVNIHSTGDNEATASSTETENGTEIDIYLEKIKDNIAYGISTGGSSISNAMESQYGLNRVAGGYT